MKVIYTADHLLHNPGLALPPGVERPHPDVPARAERILGAVRAAGHEVIPPRSYGRETLLSVHTAEYLDYLEGAYAAWVAAGESPRGVLADTFPRRLGGRAPAHIAGQAGWFCFDTETPIAEHTFRLAFAAACCALTGADLLIEGLPHAYVLCRPPGHHCGPGYCGGFCYLNNAALAAARLHAHSGARVAVLDLDYHHGNGTQDAFYESAEVLYVSIHADTGGVYPYYWGSADETGAGAGAGYNLNIPLPIGAGPTQYAGALTRALDAIRACGAAWLAVSLGTDGAEGDPLGKFHLPAESFEEMGARAAALGLPTLVVQEGGYNLDTIGAAVCAFLRGVEGATP